MTEYEAEAVDRLPFSTPEKSERYRTENYRGAVGLNWYRTDPTLQLTMAYYLQPDELAVVEPHLSDIGELMGGPVARWAEQTDRNPAHLERYDRWGHDISQVVQPTSFIESKRAVLSAQKALKDDARQAGIDVVAAVVRGQLSARSGRHRHGLCPGNGRRHGQVAGRGLCARPTCASMSSPNSPAASGKARPLSCSPSGPAAPTSERWRPRQPDRRMTALAAQRLQVVCVQLRRPGFRRAGQARGRPGLQPRRGELPGAANPSRRHAQRHSHPATERQAGHPLGGLRRGGAGRRGGLPAVRPSPAPTSPAPTRSPRTARVWAG